MRPLDRPCGEQDKLPSAKAFMLVERDKHMSEEKKPSRFMQELDQWADAKVIDPLLNPEQEGDLEMNIAYVKRAIREKVLESYRNGQKAGPRTSNYPQQKGERQAYVRR
jgi:hypothetical protein